MPEIVLTTRIRASADACFDLSLSVDAHTASMGTSGERAVGGVTTGLMGPGDTVTWEARHFGLPFRMTSKITEYERPRRFVDEQQRGPFRSWWHEHRFVERDGWTEMTDVAVYRSPLGPIGRAVDAIGLHRYMTHLLVTRNAWLKQELESD